MYRYAGDQHNKNHWFEISGNLTRIAAGSRTNAPERALPGAAARRGRIPDERSPKMPEWKQIRGNLTAISAGSRTNVWGVNAAGNIYKFSGYDDLGTSPWIQIPGSLGSPTRGPRNRPYGLRGRHGPPWCPARSRRERQAPGPARVGGKTGLGPGIRVEPEAEPGAATEAPSPRGPPPRGAPPPAPPPPPPPP
ncbi:tectonin domain-containing protein, partial [Streptomyces cyaneofuscatus]|uniref:tectonin domain-containing protein n=1 Tax=Streptomyces cyaneofuscatus TaxID=66883 RepID=UPI002FF10CA1